ncbi:MAG: beta-ribofuranosylaminobenzene 5'-phosphate synthase [Candidatus Hydrothermarchaeota archaeon]|nr:beta-ribofuranosylaminobenzene 5'-phosphate synthase [Candidatus Hydrothermarchaeota archaeon]
MLKITTPSRIHTTLIDLNASIGRIDGGIGLALEKPSIRISARESNEIKVTGFLKERAEEAAKKVLKALKIEGGIEVKIKEAYPQHVGLGSGTQIALATGKAICKIYEKNLSIREIARIAGRGGTSGIGVAAFEHGGFILDGGHSTKEKKKFLPSSASKVSPPPVLARYEFPDWKLALVIPRIKEEFYGRKEIDIFQKYCPISIAEVRKLSHLILMKLLLSLVEKDIENFGRCINEIQGIGFKKLEVSLQAREVRELMKLCKNYSYGAGLSSFGPTIYCIIENKKDLLGVLKEKKVDTIITKANNYGAKIEA